MIKPLDKASFACVRPQKLWTMPFFTKRGLLHSGISQHVVLAIMAAILFGYRGYLPPLFRRRRLSISTAVVALSSQASYYYVRAMIHVVWFAQEMAVDIDGAPV